MRIRSLSLLLLLVSISCFTFAQRRGTASPTDTFTVAEDVEIEVHVTLPNERPVPEILHVQLLSSSETAMNATYTDRDGLATFRQVRWGSYKIKVDGTMIVETVTNQFRIMDGENHHIEWIHVNLKDPNQASGGLPGPPVSTAEMNIPEKARKEVDKGMELMEKNDSAKAIEHFQKATEIYPKYARAWNNIGAARAKGGDREGARAAWQKAVEADEHFPPAYFNLARISLAEKKPADAQQLIEKGLKTAPNSPEGLFLLADCQAEQGQFEAALATAKKVHEGEHKAYGDIHIIAAQSYLHTNQEKLAIAEYETYLKENPDSPKAASIRQKMAQLQAKQ